MTPPFHYLDFESQNMGVDSTNGRFGEVSVETCKACGSRWLRYFVEHEHRSRSGRWYRAPATEEMLDALASTNAVELLRKAPWHFYGGSYFKSTGKRGTGPIIVDM